MALIRPAFLRMTAHHALGMALIVEDYRPYDRSSLWRLHDAYFTRTGVHAWINRDVPYLATCSYAIAREHARVLVALVADLADAGVLGADETVPVLEVGSGLGRFAAHLFRALERDCGPAGVALRARLRYLLSDYSRRNVCEAVDLPLLAGLHRSGQVVPAIMDVARPDHLVGLDGAPVGGKLAAVFASYVCCALPPKVLRKQPQGWSQKLARVSLEPPEAVDPGRPAAELWQELLEDPARSPLSGAVQSSFGWELADLARVLPDALHRAVLEEVTAPFAEATAVYPVQFLDFARALAPRMVPGGALFVTDFGPPDAADLAGARDANPTRYGNSLCHGVNFAFFDVFCRRLGLALVRTRHPLQSLHRLALRYGAPLTPRLEQAFQRAHVGDDRSERLIAMRGAAATEAKAGDHKAAARLYRRCLPLDPLDPELHLRLAESCFEIGLDQVAVRALRRGRKLDLAPTADFDFLLGRLHYKRGDYQRARHAFRRALRREQHPATYANLGMAYHRLGERRRAIRAYRRALALAPDGDTATTVRRKLCDLYLDPP
jgi:tetratricopeptide (TPR) repeat protein